MPPTNGSDAVRIEIAWSPVGSDKWGVRARIAVDFRRPTPIETRIRAEGWIFVARRRVMDTAARIVDAASGTELATATGVYVAADATRKREMQERYGFRRLDGGTDQVRP